MLIVDDEPNIVVSLQFLMRKGGFETSVARDGEEALLEVERFRPDLVLLDVMMPRKDGYEVCQQLRSSGWDDLKIVMLTAKGRESDHQGSGLGADAYVTKPFSTSDLVDTVTRLLGGAASGSAPSGWPLGAGGPGRGVRRRRDGHPGAPGVEQPHRDPTGVPGRSPGRPGSALIVGASLAVAGLVALVGRLLGRYTVTARRLAAETRLLLEANPAHRVDAPGPRARGAGRGRERLAERRRVAEDEVAAQIADARTSLEQERNRWRR